MNGGISMRQTRGVASRQKSIMKVVSSDAQAAAQTDDLKYGHRVSIHSMDGQQGKHWVYRMFCGFSQVVTMVQRLQGHTRQTLHVLMRSLHLTWNADAEVVALIVLVLEASSKGILTRDVGSRIMKH